MLFHEHVQNEAAYLDDSLLSASLRYLGVEPLSSEALLIHLQVFQPRQHEGQIDNQRFPFSLVGLVFARRPQLLHVLVLLS